jgi:FMN phosphatase YigB (HAD superfamily)
VLKAILFDWGETLFHCEYDDALHLAGWSAGLAASGADPLPDPAASAAVFRERYRPRIEAAVEFEADYEAVLGEAFAAGGIAVDDAGLRRFVEAEHRVEMAARRWVPGGFELLDDLRSLGLLVGLVSNACDPGWVLERDLSDSGLGARLDAAVFSSVVGIRKPFEPIFRAALAALDVSPEETLFVGDRRDDDIEGAQRLGMRTVLATWFRSEPDGSGPPPDYVATAPAEVLEIARRLRAT